MMFSKKSTGISSEPNMYASYASISDRNDAENPCFGPRKIVYKRVTVHVHFLDVQRTLIYATTPWGQSVLSDFLFFNYLPTDYTAHESFFSLGVIQLILKASVADCMAENRRIITHNKVFAAL